MTFRIHDANQNLYRAVLFVAGENGTRPFKYSPVLAANNDKEAKSLADSWFRENKPEHYEAVEICLRKGSDVVWSEPVSDHNFSSRGKL